MIRSTRFTAVLDTNVIYPVWLRDLLLWLAQYDMYRPAWSEKIMVEFEAVVRRKHPKMDEAKVARITNAMCEAFPQAMVENYHGLIDTLELDDEDDRHVLAAAIKVNANVLVTNNTKDFPPEYCDQYGVTVKSPDDFLCDLIDLDPKRCVDAFTAMVANKTNPPLNEFEVLDVLRKIGLKDTADFIHSQL